MNSVSKSGSLYAPVNRTYSRSVASYMEQRCYNTPSKGHILDKIHDNTTRVSNSMLSESRIPFIKQQKEQESSDKKRNRTTPHIQSQDISPQAAFHKYSSLTHLKALKTTPYKRNEGLFDNARLSVSNGNKKSYQKAVIHESKELYTDTTKCRFTQQLHEGISKNPRFTLNLPNEFTPPNGQASAYNENISMAKSENRIVSGLKFSELNLFVNQSKIYGENKERILQSYLNHIDNTTPLQLYCEEDHLQKNKDFIDISIKTDINPQPGLRYSTYDMSSQRTLTATLNTTLNNDKSVKNISSEEQLINNMENIEVKPIISNTILIQSSTREGDCIRSNINEKRAEKENFVISNQNSQNMHQLNLNDEFIQFSTNERLEDHSSVSQTQKCRISESCNPTEKCLSSQAPMDTLSQNPLTYQIIDLVSANCHLLTPDVKDTDKKSSSLQQTKASLNLEECETPLHIVDTEKFTKSEKRSSKRVCTDEDSRRKFTTDTYIIEEIDYGMTEHRYAKDSEESKRKSENMSRNSTLATSNQYSKLYDSEKSKTSSVLLWCQSNFSEYYSLIQSDKKKYFTQEFLKKLITCLPAPPKNLPIEELKKDCIQNVKCITRWNLQYLGLTKFQSLVKTCPDFVFGNMLNDILPYVLRCCKSVRSELAKNALITISIVVWFFQGKLDAWIEDIMNVLLDKKKKTYSGFLQDLIGLVLAQFEPSSYTPNFLNALIHINIRHTNVNNIRLQLIEKCLQECIKNHTIRLDDVQNCDESATLLGTLLDIVDLGLRDRIQNTKRTVYDILQIIYKESSKNDMKGKTPKACIDELYDIIKNRH